MNDFGFVPCRLDCNFELGFASLCNRIHKQRATHTGHPPNPRQHQHTQPHGRHVATPPRKQRNYAAPTATPELERKTSPKIQPTYGLGLGPSGVRTGRLRALVKGTWGSEVKGQGTVSGSLAPPGPSVGLDLGWGFGVWDRRGPEVNLQAYYCCCCCCCCCYYYYYYYHHHHHYHLYHFCRVWGGRTILHLPAWHPYLGPELERGFELTAPLQIL